MPLLNFERNFELLYVPVNYPDLEGSVHFSSVLSAFLWLDENKPRVLNWELRDVLTDGIAFCIDATYAIEL
ncbi:MULTISPECIES: hypothetical protein [Pseudomonas]|uniref:hypothetical protein n=1 Tax=Pseudomonas TaxID=286 RepID=UPI00048CEF87|nr:MULTISPECIES: hypothetical protein [Pseudomonas]MBH3374822.1 hypothetical protein [Pseudomonas juntendi]MDH0021365.1 hypothetical protein [Pseudomonas monteilii]QKL03238.1 hypothetical protein GEV39_18505 [Pseudomonas sp. NY5710]QKL06215.1 hypothetical protein GEV41_07160 [Pseudomonas putida]QOH72959.1 hypothetical protein IGB31_11480 [Pseudomonas putida]